jgi:hypothetical protein
MNRSLTAEEVVIVSCLAVGWAIATIARELLAPLVALVLTLLGWRPASRKPLVDSCSNPLTWEQIKTPPLPSSAPAPATGRTSSRAILQPVSLRELRRRAELLGLDHSGLTRPELIEAILDDIDDTLSNGATEALTAQQRNPSMGRRR